MLGIIFEQNFTCEHVKVLRDVPLTGVGCSFYQFLPRPGGGCEVLFSPGLSVCLCVCMCVCVCVSVCPADILVFYFSAIRRDIDLKLIQDTYRVVLNALKKH